MDAKTQKRKPLVNNSVRGRYMCDKKAWKGEIILQFQDIETRLVTFDE